VDLKGFNFKICREKFRKISRSWDDGKISQITNHKKGKAYCNTMLKSLSKRNQS
jgi:hypothetical protein